MKEVERKVERKVKVILYIIVKFVFEVVWCFLVICLETYFYNCIFILVWVKIFDIVI